MLTVWNPEPRGGVYAGECIVFPAQGLGLKSRSHNLACGAAVQAPGVPMRKAVSLTLWAICCKLCSPEMLAKLMAGHFEGCPGSTAAFGVVCIFGSLPQPDPTPQTAARRELGVKLLAQACLHIQPIFSFSFSLRRKALHDTAKAVQLSFLLSPAPSALVSMAGFFERSLPFMLGNVVPRPSRKQDGTAPLLSVSWLALRSSTWLGLRSADWTGCLQTWGSLCLPMLTLDSHVL
jgi:hypothetical protein